MTPTLDAALLEVDVSRQANRAEAPQRPQTPPKTLYTLAVDGYSEAVTDLTFPFMRQWAAKIGAKFHVIRDRRWPDYPPAYEKFQIRDLARRRGDTWSIFLDADALVHPDAFDPSLLVGKETVLHHGTDCAPIRWSYDRYFQRDGRHIGSCNWFAMASDWCRDDFWHALDLSVDEALERIHPTVNERNHGITAAHLLDDYTMSRNIARFGLKASTVRDLMKDRGLEGGWFYHEYTLTLEEKIKKLASVIALWGLRP